MPVSTRRPPIDPVPPAAKAKRPASRPPAKRAKFLGPGEPSQTPHAEPPTEDSQIPVGIPLETVIRRPMIAGSPIEGNLDCRDRSFHSETWFDIEALKQQPELRDSFRRLQGVVLIISEGHGSYLVQGTSTASVLTRRELPSRMLLIDVLLRANIFPLQHKVQRRGTILEALFRIFEGYYFGPHHLIMTYLLHFEEKVHQKKLQRAYVIPLLFPRLLSHTSVHMPEATLPVSPITQPAPPFVPATSAPPPSSELTVTVFSYGIQRLSALITDPEHR
ncbi:hypothetical protein CK203_063352 [Vitis vinifera]|uniref:Uncharacterized protein n=1 Tax=Vitis vinifera TaxID=29760 RepID=A0A438G6M3_VITVI|nr:hypothetical protein CK203_063352 [Vitis vinifera]